MQTFQTTDLIEARRCRRAQYGGMVSTVQLNGAAVTGLVHSVVEDPEIAPVQWTIQIVPKELPEFKLRRRPAI